MKPLDAIKSIQSALDAAGFYDGAIDGIPGKLTKAAFDVCVAAALAPPAVETTPPAGTPDTPAGLIRNAWPDEEDAAEYFGYPSSLTQVALPFALDTDAGQTTHITCNVRVAASLRRIFEAIFLHYNGDLAAMRADGANYYDGCYNDRNVRGSASKRSMHAYGAAIDIDAAHNELGATTGRMPRAVVDIFKAEGWRWGGDYQNRKDWMHFEACA